MKRLCGLLVISWLAALVCVPLAAAPEIARVTKVPDSDTLLIFGEGFGVPNLQVLCGVTEVVWFPDKDTAQIETIQASGRKLPQLAALPEAPPADAKVCRVVRSDDQVIVAALPPDAGRVAWVKTREGVSAPVGFAFAQPWWRSPERVAPGQDLRIFGKHLISNPYRPVSYAFFVPQAGGTPVEAPVGLGRNPYYERAVRVPGNLAGGSYDLYLHNGAGGAWGWSSPLAVQVAEPAPRPHAVLNVRDFGAVGDGMADDTDALLKALAAAEAQGGGVVYLPPGKYIAHTHLIPGEQVWLRGAGQTLTYLTVSESYGFQGNHPRAGKDAGLVILANRCGVSDVTFETGPPLTQVVWIRREPPYSVGEDVFVRRCTFRGGVAPWEPGQWRSNELPILIDGPMNRLEVSECRFDGTPGGLSGHGRVHQGIFSRNVFRSQPLYATDMVSLRHLEECVVEDNLVEFSHRGLCFQNWRGWGQFFHNCLAGNVVRDISARRDNASETYLLEGGATHWRGYATGAAASTLTAADAGWKPDEQKGRTVLIIKGRGLGQYRLVTGNDATTLALDRAWDVAPDETSYVAVGEFFQENLLLDNSDLDGDAAVQFWGSCLANVLAGHISRNAQGLWMWTYEDQDAFNPCAFNEIVNCRFLDRGAIWLTVDRADSATAPGPLSFGNLFSINQVVDFKERPGNQYWPYWLNPGYAPGECPAIALTDNAPVSPAHALGTPAPPAPARDPGVCYNVFDGDQILRGPVGIRLSRGTSGNVFRRTRMDGVGKTVEDEGDGNVTGAD
jgi:hypothetical protein